MKIISDEIYETSLLHHREIKDYLNGDEDLTGGYISIRIPSLAVTEKGTIVGICEYRLGDDWSAIDLYARRSTDCGKTFSKKKLIISGKGRNTVNNPVLIPDGEKLHLLFCENYKRMFHCESSDDGQSFSEPTEITDIFDNIGICWNVIACGPGHGFAAKSGRLYVPVWMAANRKNIFGHTPSVTAVIFSDDRGKTWDISDIIDTNGIPNPNESTVAELSDGRIMLNSRNMSDRHFRALSFSADGKHFTPYVLDENLPDPICMGSLTKDGNVLYFCNCTAQNSRTKLALKRSVDDGKSWEEFPIAESAGYSDIAVSHKDGRAYILYESDDIKYIRFAIAEL